MNGANDKIPNGSRMDPQWIIGEHNEIAAVRGVWPLPNRGPSIQTFACFQPPIAHHSHTIAVSASKFIQDGLVCIHLHRSLHPSARFGIHLHPSTALGMFCACLLNCWSALSILIKKKLIDPLIGYCQLEASATDDERYVRTQRTEIASDTGPGDGKRAFHVKAFMLEPLYWKLPLNSLFE